MISAAIFVAGLYMLIWGIAPLSGAVFPLWRVEWHYLPGIITRIAGLFIILFVLTGSAILGIIAVVLFFLAMVFSLTGKIR